MTSTAESVQIQNAQQTLEYVVLNLEPFRWAQLEMKRGVKEIPGSQDNPRIVWYHQFTDLKAQDDETSWCSAFMCAAAESNGYLSTRNAQARSWVEYGIEGDGSVGDIVVLWRESKDGWKGHIGFVARKFKKGDKTVRILGGNQGNQLCESEYDASRILAFRRFVG